jgi:pyruvate,orthophosphate dikinase
MRFVFDFDHVYPRPPKELRSLLGGKGANLAEMTSVLKLPVPHGFTITTEACRAYRATGWPDGLSEEIEEHLRTLEKAMGRKLGDPSDPLLVSVRSGAEFSMPGMMDTVLNLGLNDESVEGLTRQMSDRRFALDSYRRFVSMYARIVLGIPSELFDTPLEKAKVTSGVKSDAELPAEALNDLVEQYKAIVKSETGKAFPQKPSDQLRHAVEAVFSSWDAPRAVAYRAREQISGDLGTAVNIQAMVFGNRSDASGTGVGFTRNPATGENVAYGDFLVNAQGEDVVAGIRNTETLSGLARRFPGVNEELTSIFQRLETHFRDMCDTEFTIEEGKLWMLQTRVGKRTPLAALRMAVEMVDDPHIHLTRAEAILRIEEDHISGVLHPQFADSAASVLARGLGASPGAAVGKAYFSADAAARAGGRGEDVILIRNETSPDDVHGMLASQGVLTARGGLVSHAAVVARGWGKPAVVGCEALVVGDHDVRVGDIVIHEGDVVSIDGTSGAVVLGAVPLTAAQAPKELEVLLGWADEFRANRLGVRANADTGTDAAKARELGAEGIGLCRTEHMFLGEDRLPIVRRMILAKSEKDSNAALEELRVAQRADFESILEAMDGLPVTVRLLDPPLHEFLPDVEYLEVKKVRDGLDAGEEELLSAAREWREENPMIGTRGVRLGVVKPGLYAMQVRALFEAVAARAKAGGNPKVEVMIPLVVSRPELALARSWVVDELAAVGGLVETSDAKTSKDSASVGVAIGTMIETPRAALCAGDIALEADFFSFGTNDLTQLTFGFSRDDVESRIMPTYLAQHLLSANPFETVDPEGVGELVEIGIKRGRAARAALKVGVCGEHGGDPKSIEFFARAGVDYVSCSPYRVPVARIAAAQAVIGMDSDGSGGGKSETR